MNQDQAARLRSMMQGNSPDTDRKNLRIIAVSSGKGGVGKTNLSINLAVALAELGKRVVVMDGDLGLANVDVVCGLAPVSTLEDLITGEETLQEVLLDGPKGVKILPGGTGSNLVDMTPNLLQELLKKLEPLESLADILIIDTGAGIAKSVMQLLEAADELLVVVTPEPTSLTDAYGLVKMLLSRGKQSQISIIINRAHSKEEAESTYARLAAVMDRFLKSKVNYLGFIYEDQLLTKAVMRQVPVFVAFPSAPASRCIMSIAQNLVGVLTTKTSAGSKGIRGLMNGFLAHLYSRN